MIQLGFWQTVLIILKFWPQVVAFIQICQEQADRERIDKAIIQLRESFYEVTTTEDTASSSSAINDVFRN